MEPLPLSSAWYYVPLDAALRVYPTLQSTTDASDAIADVLANTTNATQSSGESCSTSGVGNHSYTGWMLKDILLQYGEQNLVQIEEAGEVRLWYRNTRRIFRKLLQNWMSK